MSANAKTAAPRGRKKLAQGKDAAPAVDAARPKTSSSEGGRELPTRWQRMHLGKIGRWFGGGTPSKANAHFWTDGNIPWVSPKDMKTDRIADAQDHITAEAVTKSATSLVEKGSVLVVVRSGILKHTLPVAITERDVALNQDLKAVTPEAGVRSDYLALALKAFERDILHTCCKSGTTVQNLDMPVFLRFTIPLAPENEQRRIVADIEKQFTRLDAGVAALWRVQANLKRYRAAVLKAACEGKLVPTEAELQRSEGRCHKTFESGEALLRRILAERRNNWTGRGQYKEPVAPDTSNLAPLPEGWTWATIDHVAECLDGKRVPVNKAERAKRHGDVPYYGANGQVGFIDDFIFNEPLVLVVEDETFTGRTQAFCYAIHGKSWVNNHAHVLRATSAVSTAYLNYSLSYYAFTPLTTGSTGRRKLTQKALMCAPYMLPPPAEQARIVAEVERRLSVVEELESVMLANLQRAARLRQSILKKAFTGN